MFGVLLPLHLPPLYARGSSSAFLLRKVEKRLSGNRKHRGMWASSLCKASQHETPTSAFSPRGQCHWPRGGMGPSWADPPAKPGVPCCPDCSLEAIAGDKLPCRVRPRVSGHLLGLLLSAGFPLKYRGTARGNSLATGVTSISPGRLRARRRRLLCSALCCWDTWQAQEAHF